MRPWQRWGRNRSAASGPRRVLHVEITEDGTAGGSHRSLVDLVENLDPQAFRPVVLFYQDNRYVNHLRSAGFDVYVWEEERATERQGLREGGRLRQVVTLIGAIRRRKRFIRRQRIDLVALNNSPRIGFDDWLPAARLARVPCMSNVLGLYHRPESAWQRWLVGRFDGYVANSDHVRENVIAEGLPADRVRRIYPGVDIDGFRSSATRGREEVLRVLDIPSDCVLLTMVGHIREWKGQHVVLEALRLIEAGVRSNLQLLFVGGWGVRIEPTTEHW